MRFGALMPSNGVIIMFVKFDCENVSHPMSVARERASVSFYDRGLACSSSIEAFDLIEAHKWFNLAAMAGDERGHGARTDVGMDMTPREIAEAQRRARAYRVAHAH